MAFKLDRDCWYTAIETADLRGVSLKTLEAERSLGGGIAYSRIGKRIFYRGADIDDYLAGRRQLSTSDRPVIAGPNARPKRNVEGQAA